MFLLACNILSNVSGLIVPKLTYSSYETVQDIIYDTHLPTIVGQNTLTNVNASDGIVTWRNPANELLNVIKSLLEHICPAIVILVESTENVTISLSTILPNKLMLSDNVTVNITIVQYSRNDNLLDKIKSAVINANVPINASCVEPPRDAEIIFILNSPVYDANTVLTMVSKSYNLQKARVNNSCKFCMY